MTKSTKGSVKPSEDKTQGHDKKSKDPNKPPETGPEPDYAKAKANGWTEEQINKILNASKGGNFKLPKEKTESLKGKETAERDSESPESPGNEYLRPDDFYDVGDHITYNPLSDFIYIDGHGYAIRSVLSTAIITKKDGNGKSIIDFQTVWKTNYVNDKGEIGTVRINRAGKSENKIDGHFALPLFSAEDFRLATQKYRGLLKHRNKLNRDPGKVEDITSAFHWVESAIKSVLTVPEGDLKLITCWVIAAHFHRVFNQFPPLIFGKPGYNAGGTVAMTAVSLIPFPVSIYDPTEATLFRMAEMGLSLLIDEVDPNDREKVNALNLILDGSFAKDAGIPRASGKGFTVEGFMTYGPKVAIDPEFAIVKYSTLSRSVRPFLVKDPKRSETVNMSEYIDKHRHIVDHLYNLFLHHAHKVRKAYDGIDEFTGREKQAYAPILAIAELAGCKHEVRRTLDSSIRNITMQKQGDPTKYVLDALYIFLLEERSADMRYGEFRQDHEKKHFYIEFSKLRNILKERISEIHQIDESKTYDKEGVEHANKRQWKSIPAEYRKHFDGQRFNQILMSVLGKWVDHVRGDRYGLKVGADSEEGEPLDPVLDELEKVLGIENGNSYKAITDKGEPTEEETRKNLFDDLL